MFKQMISFVAVLGLVLALAPAAQAAPLVPVDIDPDNQYVPSGVGAGEQFRLVFVTSGTVSVNSSVISTYNTFVTNQANGVAGLNALGMDWYIIGYTETVLSSVNVVAGAGDVSVPIYRVDGADMASSSADFWDEALDNPINVTQSGGAYSGNVATGGGGSGVFPANRALGKVVEGHMARSKNIATVFVYCRSSETQQRKKMPRSSPGSLDIFLNFACVSFFNSSFVFA